MKFKYLNKEKIYNEKENRLLKLLYDNLLGRVILKIIINKWFSKFVEKILNNRISKKFIKKFIKKNNIDLSQYEKKEYKSFNDFFIRKMKTINVNSKKEDYISTAEAKLSCYKISDDLIVDIKNTKYSIKELIKDDKLSKEYNEGICLIFRLEPNNYHRYIYIDSGVQKYNKKINGKLHTVNPIVYDKYKVFSENTREINILETENFGSIIQIEVGALCVGKIRNNNKDKFERFDEKGYFEFGGSTIIQLIEKDRVFINKEVIENTKNNIETVVKIGEIIGKTLSNISE